MTMGQVLRLAMAWRESNPVGSAKVYVSPRIHMELMQELASAENFTAPPPTYNPMFIAASGGCEWYCATDLTGYAMRFEVQP